MNQSSQWTSLLTQSRQKSAPTNLRRWGTAGFPSISGDLALPLTRYRDPNGYYAALGLTPNAKRSEIRAAYRRLAQIHHPDRGGTIEDFRYLSQIYEILIHPVTRKEYDETPIGRVFLGDCEIEDLKAAGVRDWAPFMSSESEPQKGYSYYATRRDDARADAWYAVLVPIFRYFSQQGQVRLSLEEIRAPYVRNYSGALPVLVIPSYLQPNYFTAFYITHQVGIGRTTLER